MVTRRYVCVRVSSVVEIEGSEGGQKGRVIDGELRWVNILDRRLSRARVMVIRSG